MSKLSVTFTEPNGAVRQLNDLAPGRSLMHVAREAGVAGIFADCGGSCTCATCHVYVDPDWVGRVGRPDAIEAALLDMVANTEAGRSRLSCQITLNEALDGLKVTVAESV
jgi:2Fe-2S ferredoxin